MRHNKLWKKAMALTCAAACAATTLAGCGSSTQAEKPSEKTEAQGESGAAEGQTEITFTVWDYETTDYWKKLVEAFEAENLPNANSKKRMIEYLMEGFAPDEMGITLDT